MGHTVLYDANKLILDHELTVSVNTDPLVLAHFTKIGAHVIWTGLSGTIDATVSIQGSNDGTNWDNLVTAVTLSGANGNDLVLISDAYCSYYRARVVKNSVLGGNLKVIVTLKE
jgi:hypothetical protein